MQIMPLSIHSGGVCVQVQFWADMTQSFGVFSNQTASKETWFST